MSVAMSSNCFVVIMLMIITLYQTLELTLKRISNDTRFLERYETALTSAVKPHPGCVRYG